MIMSHYSFTAVHWRVTALSVLKESSGSDLKGLGLSLEDQSEVTRCIKNKT